MDGKLYCTAAAKKRLAQVTNDQSGKTVTSGTLVPGNTDYESGWAVTLSVQRNMCVNFAITLISHLCQSFSIADMHSITKTS